MSSQTSALCSLGTLAYYDKVSINYDKYSLKTSVASTVRIQPRKIAGAKNRTVNLLSLTNDDVHYWHDRTIHDYTRLPQPNVRHELNLQFSSDAAEGYQISRVQVESTGHVFENTRQALCIFCKWTKFHSLSGKESLLMHMDMAHPHEIPTFLRLLLDELDLAFWPEFPIKNSNGMIVYHNDGRSNPVKYSPRPTQKEMVVRLADVDEHMLVHWFKRNVLDFHKYNYHTPTYKVNPYFNDKYPELPQIVRCDLDDKGRQIGRLAFAECLFCQDVCFYPLHGEDGLLAHMAGCHWDIDLPGREAVSHFRRFMYPK